MFFSPDMRELIGLFEEHAVEYVLVGGFAVNYYGYSRTTQAIDFLILPSPENAERVLGALHAFGFGGAGIPRTAFESPGSAIHLGVEPNRIDLLTSLKGVDSQSIFSTKKRVEMGGVSVRIISFELLVEAKSHSLRPKDLADVDELMKTRDEGESSEAR